MQKAPDFRYWNRQLFLKVYVEGEFKKHSLWAVLDSGSTVNLFAEIHAAKALNLFLDPDSSPISIEFQPWGISGFQEYKMILGQPFFQNFCIRIDFGIPIDIHPNYKNRCFPNLPDMIEIPLRYLSGQYVVSARVENRYFDIALDTGSGISSLPSKVLLWNGVKTHKKVLFPSGGMRTLPLYELPTPLFLIYPGGEREFSLNSVFRHEDVWEGIEGMQPALGMDFFSQIRIYMDFGSKIIGVDGHKR